MSTVSVNNVRAHVTTEGPIEQVRFKSTDPKDHRVQFAMFFEGDERGKILHGDTFRLDLVKTSTSQEAKDALAEAEIASIEATAKAAVEEKRAAGKASKK